MCTDPLVIPNVSTSVSCAEVKLYTPANASSANKYRCIVKNKMFGSTCLQPTVGENFMFCLKNPVDLARASL